MQPTAELQGALDEVTGGFDGRVNPGEDLRGEILYVAAPDAVHALIERLRDDERIRCNYLLYVTGQDNYLDEPRFDVVYGVRSLEHNLDVRIKVPVGGEEPEVDSITDLFPAANWLEREVFDMFGVRFKNHPNLERILMWEGFEGHPLRKDYPLLGNTPGTPGYLGKGDKR